MIDEVPVMFSAHALQQMQFRNISKFAVQQCLKTPHKTIQQSYQRYRAIQKISINKEYVLVVVYEKQPDTILIITTFITSKVEKYL